MKIAMIVSSFPVWTETFILNQIAGLIERGHDVHIYAGSGKQHSANHEIIDKYEMMERLHVVGDQGLEKRSSRYLKILSLYLRNYNYLRPRVWGVTWNMFRMRVRPDKSSTLSALNIAVQMVSQGDYDVVHCQFGELGQIAVFLKKIGAIKSKIVTSFRGHDATQHAKVNSDIYDALFREGDLFLPVSEDLKTRLVGIGCPVNKIRVLHSGIDCNKFRFSERKLEKGGEIRLLSVARLVEMKGLSYSVCAVAKLIKSGYKISYAIVGDGGLRDELEHLIRQLDMEKHIHILGWMAHDAVSRQMDAAHILLVPSITSSRGETEGIPNAAKEAMAMGIPVLSTLTGGIAELIQQGVSGFLVPERDVDALAERLSYLCDHPEQWPDMGYAGRQYIEAEFDIDKLNEKLLGLYAGDF